MSDHRASPFSAAPASVSDHEGRGFVLSNVGCLLDCKGVPYSRASGTPEKRDGMAGEEAVEEARRVFEALDALAAMSDPAARARAISQVLREQPDRNKKLKELRRAHVLQRRAENMSYRKIAAELGVSAGTVQDIERGYSGSGRDRPRKKTEKEG